MEWKELLECAILLMSGSINCRRLFVKLGILTVVNLYVYQSLIKIKSNLSDLTVRKDLHNSSTRNNFSLLFPRVRLNKTELFFKLCL